MLDNYEIREAANQTITMQNEVDQHPGKALDKIVDFE